MNDHETDHVDGEDAPDGGDEEHGHGRHAAEGPVTPAALLRQALVNEDDPRFPRWLPLPGIALAVAWAGFSSATAGAEFVPSLLWPGAGIFALTSVATWLGWQLEID